MGHGMETKFGTICQVFMSALSTNSSTIVVLISQGKSCQYCKRKQIVSTKLVANLSEVERYVNQKKKKKKIHVLAARSEARSFVQRENVCVNCVHVYCCPMHIFLLCCQEE
jgi:hypothetical protein